MISQIGQERIVPYRHYLLHSLAGDKKNPPDSEVRLWVFEYGCN